MVSRLAALVMAWLCLLAVPVAAEESMPDFGEPLAEFYDAIPDALRESLPDAVFGKDAPDAGALREAGSLGALIARARDALADVLPDTGRLLGRVFFCLIFSALFAAICTALDGGKLRAAASLCSRICTALLILEAQAGQLEVVAATLRQLRMIVNAMLPLLAAILAAGGNAGAASASGGSLLLFLNLGENLCTGIFLPMIAASGGLSAVACLSDGERLRGISACLKRITHWGIGLFGAVFSAVFAFQTVLAAGADSIAARTVKFAVGSAVPVIGGVVGDTVRTVAAGLGYLKDTVGLLGILVLTMLVLPPLVSLFVHRAVLILGEAAAELLGCVGERRLLGEFAGVSGSLLALLCGAVLCFIFALVLFVRMTLAIGR